MADSQITNCRLFHVQLHLQVLDIHRDVNEASDLMRCDTPSLTFVSLVVWQVCGQVCANMQMSALAITTCAGPT